MHIYRCMYIASKSCILMIISLFLSFALVASSSSHLSTSIHHHQSLPPSVLRHNARAAATGGEGKETVRGLTATDESKKFRVFRVEDVSFSRLPSYTDSAIAPTRTSTTTTIFYKNSAGSVFGPFSRDQIQQWCDRNLFPAGNYL